MEKDANQYVLSLLENYPEMSRKIELLRYELHSTAGVTPQEIIEVMSFSKKETECPHHVPEIAACYRNVASQLNHEASEYILETYISMLQERNRLIHYISLLEPRQAEVIQEYYINRRSWSEISNMLGVSTRTAYAVRQQAVAALAQMYIFTGVAVDCLSD